MAPETPTDVHLSYIRDKLDEILVQAKLTNGRMNAAELQIALLKQDADKNQMRANGGLLAGAAGVLGLALELLWKKLSQ